MGTYDEDIATAKELIEEAGEACTIRRMVPGVPVTPGVPVPAVPTDFPVSAVFLNYNLQSSGEPYVAGSLVKTGDKKVLVAGSDIDAITASDKIIRADGTTYQIVNPRVLDPNGQHILYTLQVRR